MFAASKTAAVASAANYIEDVFSTYLYTGNGSTGQTITNGIDLSGKGGLVWMKSRSSGLYTHYLVDSARGASNFLSTPTTNGNTSLPGYFSFGSTGFTLAAQGSPADFNINAATYASWTFRKQAKFFDVVTYTGNGVAGRTVSHNLGSVPGCIIVKNLTTGGTGWVTYHRSLGNTKILELNTTAAAQVQNEWNNTDPTSTVFSVYSGYGTNFNGDSYVAYLFAHDAGGFGAAGTDNVISCGSYTSNGSTISVNLGWEPQWILIKRSSNTGNWCVTDNMRGMTAATANASAPLFPNLSADELAASSTNGPAINATGFTVPYSSSAFNYPSGETYIYIAIRRGPMRTPTSGTSVFAPVTRTGTGGTSTITSNFVTDYLISRGLHASYRLNASNDRLRGQLLYLCNNTYSPDSSDAAEANGANTITSYANMTGVNVGSDSVGFCNIATVNYINWMFKRAPSFFDEVCYTGTGANRTVSHNLGVAPELIVVKKRNGVADWMAGATAIGYANTLYFNNASASAADSTIWNSTSPTASVFTVGTGNQVNASGGTYVAYLFASCAGVSKVGSYTGNGTNQVINCGFAAGARFVMIKRTDVAGNWYVWDTARGITAGYNPYLTINTNANQVTTDDTVNPDNSGFKVLQNANTNVNVSSATYIYLAIA